MKNIIINSKNNQKGITLIALIITIVVILILAGISILNGFGSNGVLSRASQAVTKYSAATEAETNMDIELPPEIEALLPNGKKIEFTMDSLKEYIGRAIGVYNTGNGNNTDEELPIGTELTVSNTNATVSTSYKLFYIDYDNKYGDGAGTIYLKADELNIQKTVQQNGNINTSLIYKLNPSIDPEKIGQENSPSVSKERKKKAIWLLDQNVWSELITNSPIKNYVNYIVGAPSVELFMDSYNAYYGLNGDTPLDTTNDRTIDSPRTKLFYQYLPERNKNGYYIGPGIKEQDGSNLLKSKASLLNLGAYTGKHTILPDANGESLYYPLTASNSYYLASPSCSGTNKILRVLVDGNSNASKNLGGFISYDNKTAGYCPIISLKTGFDLGLNN